MGYEWRGDGSINDSTRRESAEPSARGKIVRGSVHYLTSVAQGCSTLFKSLCRRTTAFPLAHTPLVLSAVWVWEASDRSAQLEKKWHYPSREDKKVCGMWDAFNAAGKPVDLCHRCSAGSEVCLLRPLAASQETPAPARSVRYCPAASVASVGLGWWKWAGGD